MYKFYLLVKKEVKELLTLQTVVPLLAVMLVFVFIGKLAGKEAAKSQQRPTVAILDLDKSEASALVSQAAGSLVNVDAMENTGEQEALSVAKSRNEKNLIVVPQGFGAGIDAGQPQQLRIYTVIKNLSFTGFRGDQSQAVAAAANDAVSSRLLGRKDPGLDIQQAKNPVVAQNYVQIGDRQAEISPAAVMGLVSSQTTFIPIILFLVIVFASQMIANSIATEKENKTLETLLSAPVGRNTIVASKLVGAGLVALLTAGIYIIGMRNYMNGMTGNAAAAASDAAAKAAMAQLGLVFSAADYVLLGLSLFFGILAALSVAMILAAFAEDAKSAQGVTAPLMVLILIPYFLTLFLDINTLSPTARGLVLAIPFAHPFMAAPNLLLHQYAPVLWGILYMALFFLLFVYIASRIFASDKILTMRLKFKKFR